MRKIVVAIAVVLIIAGVSLGWWFLQSHPTSTHKKNQPSPSANKNEKPANPNEHSYMDIDFARKMIVHNQQGIQMADIAKKNAQSEQVRQLAASISEELSNDTKQYIDWLTVWKETYFNLSDFPQMEGHDMYPTHPGMASLGDLRALESAMRGVDLVKKSRAARNGAATACMIAFKNPVTALIRTSTSPLPTSLGGIACKLGSVAV